MEVDVADHLRVVPPDDGAHRPGQPRRVKCELCLAELKDAEVGGGEHGRQAVGHERPRPLEVVRAESVEERERHERKIEPHGARCEVVDRADRLDRLGVQQVLDELSERSRELLFGFLREIQSADLDPAHRGG